jgi:hypothetical protein
MRDYGVKSKLTEPYWGGKLLSTHQGVFLATAYLRSLDRQLVLKLEVGLR